MSVACEIPTSFTGFCIPNPNDGVDGTAWVVAAMDYHDLRAVLGEDATPTKIEGADQVAILERSGAAVDELLAEVRGDETQSSVDDRPVWSESGAATSEAAKPIPKGDDFRLVARAVNRLSRRNRILTTLMGGLLAGSLAAAGVAMFIHAEEQRMSVTNAETFGPAMDNAGMYFEGTLGVTFAIAGALGGDAIGNHRKYKVANRRARIGVIATLRQ